MSEIIKIDSIKALRDLENGERVLSNPRPILQMIAEELYRVARNSFESQSSPDGVAWAPLSRRYLTWKSKRFPGRGLLRLRGQLLRSLKRGVDGNKAFVSEGPLAHAAVHQYGFNGTVTVNTHMRQLKARGRGKKRIQARATRVHGFTRDMRIPARPSLGFPITSERKVVQDIKAMITGAMNG
jgi:phage virion morphogenesis protein